VGLDRLDRILRVSATEKVSGPAGVAMVYVIEGILWDTVGAVGCCGEGEGCVSFQTELEKYCRTKSSGAPD